MSFWNDLSIEELEKKQTRLALSREFPVKAVITPDWKMAVPQPWAGIAYKLCQNDFDCKTNEYCSSQNRCIVGSCYDDKECQDLHQDDTYQIISGYDSFGYDLNPFEPITDMVAAKEACDANNKCVAYNSYGFLKYRIQERDLWIQQPPIPDLPDWTLNIKMSKFDLNDPTIHAVIPLRKPSFWCRNADKKNKVKGVCHQCLECLESDNNTNSVVKCPKGTYCSGGCCVNNSCYVADVDENNKWVNGRYDDGPQCHCQTKDKPYCCRDSDDPHEVAKCYSQSCQSMGKYKACKYLCLPPHSDFNDKFCMADETCCNNGVGEQECCYGGSCSTDKGKNACIKSS